MIFLIISFFLYYGALDFKIYQNYRNRYGHISRKIILLQTVNIRFKQIFMKFESDVCRNDRLLSISYIK